MSSDFARDREENKERKTATILLSFDIVVVIGKKNDKKN